MRKKGRKSKEEKNKIDEITRLGFSRHLSIYRVLEKEEDHSRLHLIFKEECQTRSHLKHLSFNSLQSLDKGIEEKITIIKELIRSSEELDYSDSFLKSQSYYTNYIFSILYNQIFRNDVDELNFIYYFFGDPEYFEDAIHQIEKINNEEFKDKDLKKNLIDFLKTRQSYDLKTFLNELKDELKISPEVVKKVSKIFDKKEFQKKLIYSSPFSKITDTNTFLQINLDLEINDLTKYLIQAKRKHESTKKRYYGSEYKKEEYHFYLDKRKPVNRTEGVHLSNLLFIYDSFILNMPISFVEKELSYYEEKKIKTDTIHEYEKFICDLIDNEKFHYLSF